MRLLFLFFILLSPAFSQNATLFGFEQNVGQFPASVLFVRRATGSASNLLYLTRDAMVLRNGVRIQIADVDPGATVQGDSPTSTIYNYYLGSDSSAWKTNVHLFSGVRVNNVYPGASALFGTSMLTSGAPTSLGLGTVTLTIQPGGDLTRFRLRVLNTGAVPFVGPGGIWFAGGSIPGVFTVTAQTTQVDGTNQNPIISNLNIESADTLSVQG